MNKNITKYIYEILLQITIVLIVLYSVPYIIKFDYILDKKFGPFALAPIFYCKNKFEIFLSVEVYSFAPIPNVLMPFHWYSIYKLIGKGKIISYFKSRKRYKRYLLYSWLIISFILWILSLLNSLFLILAYIFLPRLG